MERDSGLIRSELEKILASEGFARNERLKAFLRYVVDQELSGQGDQLKESLVGIDVFSRRPDYDVRRDPIVRTEAARLRARLAEYYANGGSTDPVFIEMPKGGYRPAFKTTPPAAATLEPAPSTTRFRRLWVVGGIALIALIATAGGWRLLENRNEPIPIAVMPFINLSADPNSDYFSDGLTGEIIRELSAYDGLVVRSQTSSFVFKGKPKNVRDAGRQLGVDYIVEGSVLRSGEQLRINAQLIRVRDDFPMWALRWNRELTEIFAIQDEISSGIVNSLRLKLGRGRRRYETSTEAYDLYLRGRAFEISNAGTGRTRSADLYEQAIAKDPSFAPAYAALAAAYVYRTGEDRVNWTGPDRDQEISRMRVVVEKAVQLDPLLAEAHAARGLVLARDGQWAQAEQSFRRALELEPNRSFTRADFALSFLLPVGRIKEAVDQIKLAKKLDPLSQSIEQMLSLTLFSAGRLEEAIAHCAKPCTRGMILQGKARDAIPILEERFKGRLDMSGTGDLGYAYAVAGRRDDAEKVAAIQPRPLPQATIFIGLGDKDRAFEALDRAIPLGPVRVGRNLRYPEFAPLRGDPRLKQLKNKMGLPD
jgi:TolB-like protein